MDELILQDLFNNWVKPSLQKLVKREVERQVFGLKDENIQLNEETLWARQMNIQKSSINSSGV